jgi:hypothetical protein
LRQFERIMVGMLLVFVDLPKDRHRAVGHRVLVGFD